MSPTVTSRATTTPSATTAEEAPQLAGGAAVLGSTTEGTYSNRMTLAVPKRDFMCVTYPGGVKNTDKVVSALGGIGEIGMAAGNAGIKLGLRFTPNSRPITSTCDTTKRLVLKVTRKRRKTSDGAAVPTITGEVLGIVNATHQFDGMADFQYMMPPETTPEVPPVASDTPDPAAFFDAVTDLRIPAPLFSREQKPQHYGFAQNKFKKIKNNTRGCTYVQFDRDTVLPEKKYEDPKQGIDNQVHRNHIDVLVKLFAKRPIYTKPALFSELNRRLATNGQTLDKHAFEEWVTRIAFRFFNGPFRSCFIRYGYDPRLPENKNSYMWQVLDCRVRPEDALHGGQSKQSWKEMVNTSAKAQAQAAKRRETQELVDTFRTGQQAHKRQQVFQLVDLHVVELHALVTSNICRDECDTSDGWLQEGLYKKLRVEFQKQISSSKTTEPHKGNESERTMMDDVMSANDGFSDDDDGFGDIFA